MPQATPKQRQRWGICEQKAMRHLERNGYVLTEDWRWVIPPGHKPTERERSAAAFLCDEWDFGGFITL